MPEERLTVSPDEWVRAVGDARDRGYTYFDWLSAVDETDREEEPGLDVVCHLLDPHPGDEAIRRLPGSRVPLQQPTCCHPQGWQGPRPWPRLLY